METQKVLSTEQRAALLKTLEARFGKNMNRHKELKWADVQAKLEAHPDKLWSLNEMETTGGEPDVVAYDNVTNEYVIFDCSAETPQGRRSICYDQAGQAEREKKGIHPGGNALEMAAAMGTEILTEDQYQALQKLGNFDTKTSSWLSASADIRKLGGAIFGDRRYGHVFVYHNGAASFYSGRAFRGSLRV